jgi:hypothetical protein
VIPQQPEYRSQNVTVINVKIIGNNSKDAVVA